MHVAGVGNVSLISILDVVSRWQRSRAICVERRPIPLWRPINSCSDVPTSPTGLPRRISFDHGTVFYDNTSPSPFPTRLHLWLLALGIEVCFIRKRCPTDHAKIERTHQTMTLQALLGQRWPDQTALWAGLDARRAILNQSIPSCVLHGRASLQAYPKAAHSGHSYRPE